MQDYSVNLIIQSVWSISKILFDIGIMWFLIYYVVKIIKNNSRTIQIFKGIIVIVVVDALAKLFGLTTVAYFADVFINWGFLAIIIIFQPELRGLLEKLGKTNAFSKFNVLFSNEKEKLANAIYEALVILSKNQIGAIISIEQTQSMQDYIKTGIRLNSEVNKELLVSIFMTTTPLHDGAVIIQGNKIACASAYFPPTAMELPSRYGARHRAALGISEVIDAVTIVVSEETSQISIAEKGKMVHVTNEQLKDFLNRIICNEEIEIREVKKTESLLLVDEPEMVIEKDHEEETPNIFKSFFNNINKNKKQVKENEKEDIDIKVPLNNFKKYDSEIDFKDPENKKDDDVISIEDYTNNSEVGENDEK